MRIGIASPVVTQVPGVSSPWESSASIADLGTIAETADRLGFHHLTCSEHVAVPTEVAETRGATYWDPLATFGYLAAVTRRIRFATQVLVLGYHHPLAIAKRYGTLDRISGGRLTLGLGVGSLQEEFDLLQAPFSDRGRRADEALQALRASLSRREPEFHGQYYDFADFVVDPHGVQEHAPFWIGGRTRRSLRRAITHGDGWVPFGLRLQEIADILTEVELPQGFEVVLSAGRPLDPAGEPEAAEQALRRAAQAGATVVGTGIRATSVEHYCAQLDALQTLGDKVGATFGGRDD